MNRVAARGTVSQDRDIRLILGQLQNNEYKKGINQNQSYLKDTTELLYNQNLEMKIAKYRLNRLVKDAGLGLSKGKGGSSDPEPFHQKFGN